VGTFLGEEVIDDIRVIMKELLKLGIISVDERGGTLTHRLELLPLYPSIYYPLLSLWVRKLSGLVWNTALGVDPGGSVHAALISYILKKPFAASRGMGNGLNYPREAIAGRKILLVAETFSDMKAVHDLIKEVLTAEGTPVGFTCLLELEKVKFKFNGVPFIPLIRASRLLRVAEEGRKKGI
jgi:orotate phosphoribosyltransferase